MTSYNDDHPNLYRSELDCCDLGLCNHDDWPDDDEYRDREENR